MQGPSSIYVDYFKKECSVSGANVTLSEAQIHDMWRDAQRILLEEIRDELYFRGVYIGKFYRGQWSWNWKAWNDFDSKTRHDDPAWCRFDYLWSKITNNVAWHPGHYKADEIDVNGWTRPSEPCSPEMLWLVLMLHHHVWKR